jgi:hypothetical protein
MARYMTFYEKENPRSLEFEFLASSSWCQALD